MKSFLLSISIALFLLFPIKLFSQAEASLELVADNLVSPVTLVESPDDSGRLFIVDQIGVI